MEVHHGGLEARRHLGSAYLGDGHERAPGRGGARVPSTSVVIPVTGAALSGRSQVLDAAASPGVTQVEYEITGETLNNAVVATATPTIYGWIALWNTTGVANGTYALQSVASSSGVSGTSSARDHHREQSDTEHERGHPSKRSHDGHDKRRRRDAAASPWTPASRS